MCVLTLEIDCTQVDMCIDTSMLQCNRSSCFVSLLVAGNHQT